MEQSFDQGTAAVHDDQEDSVKLAGGSGNCKKVLPKKETSCGTGQASAHVSLTYRSRRRSFGAEDSRTTFIASKSKSPNTLKEPPSRGDARLVGDIHHHEHPDGDQYWIVDQDGSWSASLLGDEHPILGKFRVLSHRSGKHLPNWVLSSTFTTYQSRTKTSDT